MAILNYNLSVGASAIIFDNTVIENITISGWSNAIRMRSPTVITSGSALQLSTILGDGDTRLAIVSLSGQVLYLRVSPDTTSQNSIDALGINGPTDGMTIAEWRNTGLRLLYGRSLTLSSNWIHNPVNSSGYIITGAAGYSFTGIAYNIDLPGWTPGAAASNGFALTGLYIAQGPITNPSGAIADVLTFTGISIAGAAGQTNVTGVYSWTGMSIATPAQAANGVANAAIGLNITGGAQAGTNAYQRGIQITMAAATSAAITLVTGGLVLGANKIHFDSVALVDGNEGLSIDTSGAITIDTGNTGGTPTWSALTIKNRGNYAVGRGISLDFNTQDNSTAAIITGRIAVINESNIALITAMTFSTYTGAALVEKWRISNTGVFHSLGAVPAAVVAAGSIIAGGGIAIGADALNNLIDDASGGTGSTAIFIGNAQITAVSDIRVKENVVSYTKNATDILRKMNVKEFDYLDEYRPYGGGIYTDKYVGMTAQDLFKLTPWVVNTQGAKDCPNCSNGKKCDTHKLPWQVNHQLLSGIFVKSIQEIDSRLQEIENTEWLVKQVEKAAQNPETKHRLISALNTK